MTQYVSIAFIDSFFTHQIFCPSVNSPIFGAYLDKYAVLKKNKVLMISQHFVNISKKCSYLQYLNHFAIF